MNGRRASWMAAARDERGSVLPMTALMVTVVLGFTAFAVDLGLSRVAVRDMQSVADAVALDTARSPALSSCNATTLTQVANSSLTRQQARMGRTQPLQVTPGRVDAAGDFTAASTSCNAVRITSSTEVDYAFAPVIGTDSGTASRSAIGTRAEPAICFSAGTRTLVLDSSNSELLGPVLDQVLRVNLGVAGYDGLVGLKNISIPLAGLATELGVGTPDEVLSQTLSLGDFLVAAANVLPTQGNAATIQALESVAAQVQGVNVAIGDFLSLDTGDGAGLRAEVNALDLVGGAIVAANGTNALNVDSLGITLPARLVDTSISASIIEPPRIACGRTGSQARNTQVRIDLDSSVGVGGLLRAADVRLGILAGDGTATLGAMTCGAGGSPATATVSAQTSGARVVGPGGAGNARLDVVSLLGLRLGVDLRGSVASSGTASHTFTYPTSGLPDSHTFGSPLNLSVEVVNQGLLGLLLSPVTTLLTTILNPALEQLLTPLLDLLGVKIGAMDVTMLGRPSCASVRLAG